MKIKPANELLELVTKILLAAGADERNASVVAEHLVRANLSGVDTHGVWHLASYVEAIKEGLIIPTACPAIVTETPNSALVTGNWTFGQAAAQFAMETAIEKSKSQNVAVVALVQSHHVGRLGHYTERAAAEGMISMVWGGGYAEKAPAGMALLLTDDPYRAYARIAALFHPLPTPRAGLDPTAVIDETAVIDPSCRVDAGAVVGPGATIGPRCHLSAHAVIGPNVVLGSDCIVGPSAALVYAIIGARVVIHTGVRIGQDGFGFALGAEGHLKVPQLGRVVIGDDVEIGANTTIDRGTGPDTVIGAGTKIDNLVQIAHNVRLGRGCVVVAQVGISGSTTVGDFAMIGGQAGLTGHLDIGAGARIAAQAGVMADVDPGAAVGGSPSRPIREWMRGVAIVQRMVRKRRGG